MTNTPKNFSSSELRVQQSRLIDTAGAADAEIADLTHRIAIASRAHDDALAAEMRGIGGSTGATETSLGDLKVELDRVTRRRKIARTEAEALDREIFAQVQSEQRIVKERLRVETEKLLSHVRSDKKLHALCVQLHALHATAGGGFPWDPGSLISEAIPMPDDSNFQKAITTARELLGLEVAK